MLRKTKPIIPFLLVIGSLILSACALPVEPSQTPTELPTKAETPAETPAASPDLAGTAWMLESIGETPVIFGSRVTLTFEDGGQATGLGGCNSYGAGYRIEGDSIAFEDVTSTLMACEPAEIMEQEAEFFAALGAASSFELAGDRLIILYDDGQGALQFIPAEDKAAPESTESPGQNEGAGGETPEVAREQLCDPAAISSTSGQVLCRSQRFGFEVLYSQEAKLVDQTATSARIELPFTEGTNLTEKYVEMTVMQGAGECASPLAAGSPSESIQSEPVEIAGLSFLRQSGVGAAAGNRYDWLAYSTERNGRCVSLGFVLHSFDPELVPTPPPTYDRDAEAAVFDEIVKSFRWLEPAESDAAERIVFAPGGTSAEVTGDLAVSGSHLYVIRALQGQTMTVDLSFTSGRAVLAVWGADGAVLLSDHAEASRFSRELPATQDYFIQLKGSPESATAYRMTVTIPPAGAQPNVERISFERGKTSAERTGSLPAAGSALYVINAMQGQTMTVELSFTAGQAILSVWGADGTVLMSDHAEAPYFSGVLPATQDYYVHLKGHPDQATNYRLTVTIPPLGR